MVQQLVDESFSGQQICKSVNYTFIVTKTGCIAIAQPGLMVGCEAGQQTKIF